MAAYYIISYDITDREGYPAYVAAVADLLPQYGAKVLVSDLEAVAIEGKAREVNAIVVFPSQDSALECYRSEAYQKIKAIRIETTRNGQFILAKDAFG